MKTQIAFRDTGHIQNSFKTVIAVGLIEFQDRNPLPDGMIGNFFLDMHHEETGHRPDGLMNLNAFRQPIDKWGYGLDDGAATTDSLTQQVWNAPNMPGVAQLFMRRTRVEPSRPGLAVMAYAGLVSVRPGDAIDQDGIFQLGWKDGKFAFEGRVGQDLHPEWGAPGLLERMEGDAISSFLRVPFWGFGEEPISVPWTMPLELADAHDRYIDLSLKGDRSPVEDAELAELRKGHRLRALDNLDRDTVFRSYIEELNARGLRLPSAQARTRGQDEQLQTVTREIVEALTARPGRSM